MLGEGPAHAVHWFAWANLKGAAISLLIGAGVYLLIIRRLLMRRNGEKGSMYVDCWPSRLDLEEAIYRPLCALITRILTTVSGWVDTFGSRVLPGMVRKMTETFGRIAAGLPDLLTGIVNKTILRRIPVPPDRPEDHQPDDLGVRVPIPDKAIGVMTGFSYGLILFGIGLVAVILYLIMAA